MAGTLMFPALLAFSPAHAGSSWLLVPSDPQAAAIARRVREAVVREAGRPVKLLREVAAGLPKAVEPAPPASAQALALGIEGSIRRYYYQRDRVKAARAIAEAVDQAVALLPRLVERTVLWTAVRRGFLLLATNALGNGNRAEAVALCGRVARRDPSYAPPDADWSPRLRKVYAQARAGLPKRSAVLRVAATAGTRVFVDGLERGKAPLRFSVRPGKINIQGFAGAVLGPVRTAEIRASGGELRLDPECHDRARLVTAACRSFLRRAAGAEVVLGLAATGNNLVFRAWRGDAIARQATMELPSKLTAKWVGELAAFLAGQRDKAPIVEIATKVVVRTIVKDRPFYKRWWFWTLVGVIAAGGTTAAIVAPRGGRTIDLVVER